MKKTIALLLSAVMILALVAGCGSSTGNDEKPNENAATETGQTTEPEDTTVVADPDWPSNGTLNVVVGWGAGGTTDLIARKVASLMSVAGGFNNNCTNVTGASGSIAAAQVAEEGGDGQTAWGGMISAVNTWRCMDYNEMSWKDWYTFISCQTDFCLAVSSKDDRFSTYQDFVDYAAANPDKLSAGNPGLGSVGHLAAVTFCNAFGVSTNHVPYAGGRAAAVGVMGGEIDYVFIAYGDIKDLVESGDLKALAFTGEDRNIAAATGEYTVPGLDAVKPEIATTTSKLGMWGVALPRTVAPEIVLAFQESWSKCVSSSEYQDYCTNTLGVKPVAITGVDADKTMAEGEAVYIELLESLGLTAKSAADLGVSSSADYSWDSIDLSDVNSWPNE